jgi:hypothetical protein
VPGRPVTVAVARSYLAGTGPFPERAAVVSLVGQFHTDVADMVRGWADRATAAVATWAVDPSLPSRTGHSWSASPGGETESLPDRHCAGAAARAGRSNSSLDIRSSAMLTPTKPVAATNRPIP